MAKSPALIVDFATHNAVYHQRFTGSYDYPVHFTEDLFHPDNPVFVNTLTRLEAGKRHRCAVFIDAGVAAAMPGLEEKIARYMACHEPWLSLAARPEIVPGGEQVKEDPVLVERLQRRLMELGIDRHSFVVAIGGGGVLDMVGYVAATSHRGVRHVRVPTTVLSQNDSGVGVKNAVNAFGLKNFLGTFAPPFAVLIDADFIATLPRRDRIAGIAEAVKVALIRDETFFCWLEAHAHELASGVRPAMDPMIRRCAELHMHQIARGKDPFEMGSNRPLDYGHWVAHKLESLTRHALRHGEAVAIGIALDSRYAVQIGWLPAGQEERIYRLLRTLGFSLWHPALEQRDSHGELAILAGLREFQEHLGGELSITLLTAVGHGKEAHAMDAAQIKRAIAWLRTREMRS